MDELLKMILENPEATTVIISSYVEKYKPVLYSVGQELHNIYKDYANNTEYPQTVAKVKKNMFDAYVGVGFTEDQAMALMINDNIQLMNAVKRSASSVNTNKK